MTYVLSLIVNLSSDANFCQFLSPQFLAFMLTFHVCTPGGAGDFVRGLAAFASQQGVLVPTIWLVTTTGAVA